MASVSLAAATGKVKITAKHPGEMPFSVTIRNRLTDKDRKECIIYTGTTEFEKVYFSAGDNEAASLVSAFANSKNFTANLEESAKGIMTNVNQTAFTGGKNPTVATANYSAAFSQAEKYFFNTICVVQKIQQYMRCYRHFWTEFMKPVSLGLELLQRKITKI